jgi:hypothetical protein
MPITRGIGNDFLNRTPIAQEIKARIDKWECIKLKTCTAKETNQQSEEAVYRMGENLCRLFIRQ